MKKKLVEWLLGYSWFRKLVMEATVKTRHEEQIMELHNEIQVMIAIILFKYSADIGYPREECLQYIKKWKRIHKNMIRDRLTHIL